LPPPSAVRNQSGADLKRKTGTRTIAEQISNFTANLKGMVAAEGKEIEPMIGAIQIDYLIRAYATGIMQYPFDIAEHLLYESTILRMSESKLYSAEKLKTFFKFQLVPDHGYLTKIEQSQKKFARIYPVFDQDVKYEVRGYTFPFTLYAAPEVQKFVFILGLGAFTHKGFGMLDIANIDPTKRTKEYKIENYI